MKPLVCAQRTQQGHLAGCRTRGQEKAGGTQWKAKSKHRLDLGVGELRGIEGHWVSEGWRGCFTAGVAVSCQVWVDSQGSLSASRNISIFHLPSPLAGLIRARLTARQRAACPALRCTDVWLYPKRQKNLEPVTLPHCKNWEAASSRIILLPHQGRCGSPFSTEPLNSPCKGAAITSSRTVSNHSQVLVDEKVIPASNKYWIP